MTAMCCSSASKRTRRSSFRGTVLDREPFGFDGRIARTPFYENRFRALRADVPFRPDLTIPKPRMGGLHRAIVSNEEGAAPNPEINSNANGDVRVRFAWDDRMPEPGIASSHWIPVVNAWSGTGWGAMQTPRVGQTVYVAFHDGDPDQAVVLGGYYSAQTPPPYDASRSPTVSGMRSQSSPGGGGSNEISFDDSAGSEKFSTNAQKDASDVVGNDYNQDVGGDHGEDITGDKSTDVGGDHSHNVGGSEVQTRGADKLVKVGGNYTISAGGDINLDGDMVFVSARSSVLVSAPRIELSTVKGAAELVLEGSNATLQANGLLKAGGLTVLVEGDAVVEISAGGNSAITLSASMIRQIAAFIYLNPEGG